jgi:hypothetical protein
MNQAVSRRLPTAAGRLQSQVKSCGICDEENGAGTGFLCQLLFLQLLHLLDNDGVVKSLT